MPRLKPILIRQNLKAVKQLYPELSRRDMMTFRDLVANLQLSVTAGELLRLGGAWYVSHSGLLKIARRHHCHAIQVSLIGALSNPEGRRWVFKATVYKSGNCRGFAGYGDADPSNVSSVVRGAEMRVAETRAVNRALRKAYGIGICSVEEIGSLPACSQAQPNVRTIPPQPADGDGQPKLRDQLCLLIRQHRLDASLVKQYAAEFCGAKDLRQASREQIQSFITHLAESAANDREALLCKLNSYASPGTAGAA
jgi:hypothetical protein